MPAFRPHRSGRSLALLLRGPSHASMSRAMPQSHTDTAALDAEGELDPIHEPRLWRDKGWTARVIKNEDGDGWAVERSEEHTSELQSH